MWEKYKIEQKEFLDIKIGEYQCIVRRNNKAWDVVLEKLNKSVRPSIVVTDKSLEKTKKDWRTIISDTLNTILVLPALPDKPVVLKPENIFRILPHAFITIYIKFAVWVQLYSGGIKKDENLMLEFSSTELSNTWFGAPDEGEAAYSSFFYPVSEYTNDLEGPDYIVSPIKLINESSSVLDFERLSVPVMYLTLYSLNHLLFSNEIRIKYKGENQVADVSYAKQPPAIHQGMKQISVPRKEVPGGILHKSFHLLKSITQY